LGLFTRESGIVVGVDISSTGIKVAELTRVRSGFQLRTMAIVPLTRDAIVEGTIVDSKAVTEALKQAFDIARPSTRNVSFAVSGNAVIIKTITIPTMTEFELESQIRFEAEQFLPFDIDEVYLDFQILGETPHDPEAMEVLVVACKRDVIDDFRLALSDAGLQTKLVDCAVFCTGNAFELLHQKTSRASRANAQQPAGGEEQADALVNIGASMININIVCRGRTRFVRDLFFGGNNLTEEIRKAHGLTFDAAEQVKLKNFSGIGESVLDEFYIQLVSDLGRSLDYYAANNAEYPVGRMYLSGGCALIPGIAGELEQRLGVETRVFNPFESVKLPKRKYDQAYLDETGPRMVIALGLALRSFDQ